MVITMKTKLASAKKVLAAKRAEGYVDTGVKVIIAVVIGALVIALLVVLWKTVIDPNVSQNVTDLFTSQVG